MPPLDTHPYLFSILVANYNNGEYLQEAIDSILAQTYPNWEVIIVDDKSTDESTELYQRYATDARFKIYFNDQNRGCGYTKRRCIELANGQLCGFLDPDDALAPQALEIMAQAHSEHPECSLIYSTCYRYSGNTEAGMPIWDLVGEIPAGLDMLIYRKKIAGHFASFKKESYDKTVGINPFLKADVDGDLYLLLEEAGRILYIPKALYFYRINNAKSISIGNDKAELRTYHYSLITHLDAICRRMGGPLFERNQDEYIHYMRVLLPIYRNSMFFDRKRFAKYLWYYFKAKKYSPKSLHQIFRMIKGK